MTDKIKNRFEEVTDKWSSVLLEEAQEATRTNDDKAYKKFVTARLLENTDQFLRENKQQLNETGNFTTGIDIVDPVIINMVRRNAPNNIGFDLVGVQPMTGPVGLIFAFRPLLTGTQPVKPFGRPGDATNGAGAGSDLDSAGNTTAQDWGLQGIAPNEAFKNEPPTTYSGTGTQTSNATAPNYDAYSVGIPFETLAAETMGRGLSGDEEWSDMTFTIDKTNVRAKTRALRGMWTRELEKDARTTHGLDVESEIANMISTEMVAETNREIVNTIRMIAKKAPAEKTYSSGTLVVDSAGDPVLGTVAEFDLEVNSDGRWQAEKYKSLIMKIHKEANAIAKDTRMGRGNFIIVSSNVAALLDTAGKLIYSPAIDNNLHADDTGPCFIGMLGGRYKVFIDPYLGYDEVIVGFKGNGPMNSGMFYCPYVPMEKSVATNYNDFQPRMAYKSRYGIVANPFTTLTRNSNSYYRKFVVTNV